jgi:hypothetical protein
MSGARPSCGAFGSTWVELRVWESPSEKSVESHEVVITDRRGYNDIKMLAFHENALMRVENVPKFVVDFSDVRARSTFGRGLPVQRSNVHRAMRFQTPEVFLQADVIVVQQNTGALCGAS